MRNYMLFAVLVLAVIIFSGCVEISQEEISRSICEDELSGHVHFLAQPALKGRKPKSRGSAAARDYLKTRFEAYGLKPWPGVKGYEDSFAFGTNMLGVLPGSDPELSKEIVILAAHYDHVGKGYDKKFLLGACDNASGVAALLEAAEYFSLAEEKPKRSICFAAFDCEENMLLGSLIFTCQEYFEKQKIAAVVNIDMLGRDFLDVVEDSLFVAGCQSYPRLSAGISKAKEESGLNIFQLSTQLIGPRGDHVVFQDLDVPVLFFSCGLNKDYHKVGDTAEKLDYAVLEKSAKVIADTVESLANADMMEEPVVCQTGDREELRALRLILDEINVNHDVLEVDEKTSERLQVLVLEIERLLGQEQYTLKQRGIFLEQTAEALLPLLMPVKGEDEKQIEASRKCNLDTYLDMQEMYGDHLDFFMGYAKGRLKEILKDKPSLLNIPDLDLNVFLISEDSVSFVERQDGNYNLDMIFLKSFEFSRIYKPKKKLFSWKPKGFHFPALGHEMMDFRGTKDQVIDYCLLQWRKQPTDEFHNRAWGRVLEVVVGDVHGQSFDEWMQWNLDNQGVKDQEQWLTNLREGDNQMMAHYAGKKYARRESLPIEDFHAIIKDPNSTSKEITSAIWGLLEVNKESMLLLLELFDDETLRPEQSWSPRYMDEDYPFAHHRAVKKARQGWAKMKEKGPGTIGDVAKSRLSYLANLDRAYEREDGRLIVPIETDFGVDAEAWRKWISKNVK